MALAILFSNFLTVSNAAAAQFLGYPVSPTQLRFYLLILSLIGFSLVLVSAVYFSFWILDLKTKRSAAPCIDEAPFAGELVAAAQPAK